MDKIDLSQEDKKIFFEQYKLAVEMADRISARREGANKIFLSVNSIMLVFLATRDIFSEIYIFISIFGILLSLVWASILKSYGNLNSAKYVVIKEMEKMLPGKVYIDESNKINKRAGKKVYEKLTIVERRVTLLFLGFYIFLLIYVLVKIG